MAGSRRRPGRASGRTGAESREDPRRLVSIALRAAELRIVPVDFLEHFESFLALVALVFVDRHDASPVLALLVVSIRIPEEARKRKGALA